VALLDQVPQVQQLRQHWNEPKSNQRTTSNSVEVVEQMDLNRSKCSSLYYFFWATFILRAMSEFESKDRPKVRNTLHLGTITDTLTICEKTQNPKEKSTDMLLAT